VQPLCSAWKDDGTTVFSGGCDKLVKMWPLLSGGQPMAFSGHEAPIKELAWIPQMNLLVSGSWDKTLRYENVHNLQRTFDSSGISSCIFVWYNIVLFGLCDF
jgi:mRNA export factor